MPGRGQYYADQNLQLQQGGAAAFGQAIDQQRALAAQDAPASPIEKMLGRAMAKRVHELLAGGADPHEVATMVKLGHPAVTGGEQPQQPPQGMAVGGRQQSGPPTAQASQSGYAPPLMGPPQMQGRGINPAGGMAGQPMMPPPPAAAALPPPGPVSAGPWQGPPDGMVAAPQGGMASPTTAQSPWPMPPPDPIPEIQTRKDYASVMGAGDTAAKFLPKGSSDFHLQEKMQLEGARTEGRTQVEGVRQGGRMAVVGAQQEGSNARAGQRDERKGQELALRAKKIEADVMMFKDSTRQIDNALALAKATAAHAQTLVQAKSDANAIKDVTDQTLKALASVNAGIAKLQSSGVLAHLDELPPEVGADYRKQLAERDRLQLIINDLQKKTGAASSVDIPGAVSVQPGPTHGDPKLPVKYPNQSGGMSSQSTSRDYSSQPKGR